jgi:hypothetical protein
MVASFGAYLHLNKWTSPGRIPPEIIRFCFFLDIKCIRSVDDNKKLLRKEQALLRVEAILQDTSSALQCIQLQAMAAAVD